MAKRPAPQDPERDKDPARHARESAGEAPLPAVAASAGVAFLPACGLDWLDDAGWAASLAARQDEDEPSEPELEDGPPDFDALAAVIAGARELSAAEARDAARAARLSAAGGFGVVGGAHGRRGPGMPGSAEVLAGESASAAAGFGSGLVLDTAPGCGVLLDLAAAAAGEDDSFPGASDDEVAGVICALDRVEAHVAARKLAAVAEFIRRRPAEGCAPQGGAAEGGAAEAGAAEGSAILEESRRLPEGWHEFAVEELAWALAESKAAAEGMLDLAHDLEVKLPGTRAAFRDGILTARKAAIIAAATEPLTPKEARAAEELVLGRAGRLTPGGLRAAIAMAVMAVAPEKAKKRREEAAKTTRVERWAEDSGNGGLAGRELPPAEVLAADQRITAWARELGKAGLEGDMDQLRARAYLDLLLGTDSRPAAPAGKDRGASGQDPAADGRPGDTATDGGDGDARADAGDRRNPEGGRSGPAGAGGPRPAAGGPGAGVLPAGFVGRMNLTVPLVTVLGLADRPGEAPGLGPIDPWLARDLAAAAARNPKTTWCLTVTDQHGHAIGHGCARPEPTSRGTRTAGPGRLSGPDGHDPPRRPGGRDGPPASGLPPDLRNPDGPRFTFTAAEQHGPPGGHGTWRLSTGTPGQPDLIIRLHPVATKDCDHRFQVPGHDPGVLLRHLTEIRHATCTAPTCRRPASNCDFEHNTSYESGGRTCMCNGGPKCRRHHRLKQHPRWKAEQPTPATFRWTTPAGRVYTTEPTRYPI